MYTLFICVVKVLGIEASWTNEFTTSVDEGADGDKIQQYNPCKGQQASRGRKVARGRTGKTADSGKMDTVRKTQTTKKLSPLTPKVKPTISGKIFENN